MAGVSSAIALAGGAANFANGLSGTILVYREDRLPPDIVLLSPPIPMDEADELAARTIRGETYSELGIIPTDVTPRPLEQSRWFMKR